jgi:uncharacterized protein involved in exopolysaccharide biosynthesis
VLPPPQTQKTKPILIGVGAILIALFPLLRWIASVYLRNAPRTHFSVVSIEIRPDFNAAYPAGSGDSPEKIGFLYRATQIQRIQTAEVLTPVIEKLDLEKKLSPPGTTMPMQWVTENLLRCIVVQEQRNTTLVEIGVYHADRQLAADIANTIAITYRDKCIEKADNDRNSRMNLVLAEMKNELKAKREEVSQLFQEATRIRREDKIVDPDPENENAILSFSAERAVGGLESPRTNRYFTKKATYLATKQLLLGFEKNYERARIDNADYIPPVKIWQRAQPAQTPVRPDAVAILRLANAIGGLLAAIGVVLILIALRMKSPEVHANVNTAMSPDRED